MKKILSFMLAMVMLLSIAVMPSFAETEYMRGDTNGDGKVQVADASLLLKYIAGWDIASWGKDGLVECIEMNGDINYDGKIGMADAVALLKYIIGPTYVVVLEERSAYWSDCADLREKGQPEPTFDEWLVENGYDVESYKTYEKWRDDNPRINITYEEWLERYGDR